MKILTISNLFPPEVLGGYEIGCSRIVAELARRGHEIEVLTTGTGRDQVDAYKINRALVFSNVYKADADDECRVSAMAIDKHNSEVLWNRLSKGNFDVVYVFNIIGLGGLQIVDMLNNYGIPWVWHLMDRVPFELLNNVPQSIYGIFECSSRRQFHCDAIILMSRTLRAELSTNLVGLDGAIHIVPGWVDASEFFDARNGEARADGPHRFVSAGSMSMEKGTDLILKAAASLSRSRKDFAVDIYGPGDAQKYRRMAQRLGVDSFVSIKGSVPPDSMKTIWRQYDALLFPTWSREPFGFVALEAAAAGLVPIITTGAGVTEVLDEGKHFIGVDRTPASVCAAMERVMSDARVGEIADACRRRAVGDLSLDKAADAIETILADVVKNATEKTPPPEPEMAALLDTRLEFVEGALALSSRGAPKVAAGQLGLETLERAKGLYREWRLAYKREGVFSAKYLLGRFLLTLLKRPLVELAARIMTIEQNNVKG